MTELDLFTQLLESTAVDGVKLADIPHKTAELLQSTLFLPLMDVTILRFFVFSKALQ